MLQNTSANLRGQVLFLTRSESPTRSALRPNISIRDCARLAALQRFLQYPPDTAGINPSWIRELHSQNQLGRFRDSIGRKPERSQGTNPEAAGEVDQYLCRVAGA